MLKHSDDLVEIHMMNLESKILEAFEIFPRQYRIDLLLSAINDEGSNIGIKMNMSLITSTTAEDDLELYVSDFGVLTKYYDPENEDPYEIRFEIYNNPNHLKLMDLSKEKCNEICRRIIPFMLSRGKNKNDIPLLVNDFQEFAQWALKFNPWFFPE
jgi:hypothetical protein